ncbi:rho GTPase-activating protein [Malassezia cuniculi]|uniref:Rho GTPase-activating protein n=1 Tax=Malassezia cuniculi TaxID=948313 RepID=A0AAF0EQL8_9BASI|nr:rho GTPase-activating protein [Malassezia cuniculi]
MDERGNNKQHRHSFSEAMLAHAESLLSSSRPSTPRMRDSFSGRPGSLHRSSIATHSSATSLDSMCTSRRSSESTHTILTPISRTPTVGDVTDSPMSQSSNSSRLAQRSRSLFSRIANRIGRGYSEEEISISACGFLKRSTGPLSLAWWSDALPSSRRMPIQEPGLGWRPFKAVLSGNRILFFKVPSVLIPEVRSTFVIRSTIWPTPIESDDEGDADEKKSPPVDGEAESTTESVTSVPTEPDTILEIGAAIPERHEGPWDNATRHPDLVTVRTPGNSLSWTARIESGTLAALAHELVFATQSVSHTASDDETTFFLILFYSLGTSGIHWDTFLHELCAQIMLSKRLELHNTEIDCIGRASRFIDVILTKRPLLSTSRENEFFVEMENLVHLVRQSPESYAQTLRQLRTWRDAVSNGSVVVAPPDWLRQSSLTVHAIRMPQIADIHTCWYVQTFLAQDSSEIARQIQIFHAGRLRAFMTVPPTAYRLSSLMTEIPLRSFRFDAERPHWISHAMLRQLVVDDSSERQLSGMDEFSRAAILQHWIHIASHLLAMQDFAGWAAICGVLCSRTVAILEDAWRVLPREERTLVALEWAPLLKSLGWLDGAHNIVAPLFNEKTPSAYAIPYFGNVGILRASRSSTRHTHTVRVAANEPEFMRARALSQQLANMFFQPESITPCGDPVFEYQCLFQRLSQHEYPLHTSISDYVGSAVAATTLTDRRPLRMNGMRSDTSGAPLNFPMALPECSILNVSHDILRFPSISPVEGDGTEDDYVAIRPDLILRPAPNTQDIPIWDLTLHGDHSTRLCGGVFLAEIAAASRDRLLDILVIGTQHMIVRSPLVGHHEEYSIVSVGMDMDAFRDAFIYSYAGAYSPHELFDTLKTRWTRAELASREMGLFIRMHIPNQFPSWSRTPIEARFALEPPNRGILNTILLGIIYVLHRWIDLRPTDWLPDQMLAESLQDFVKEAYGDLSLHAWAAPDVRDALLSLSYTLDQLPMQRIAGFGASVIVECLPGEDTASTRMFDWKTQGSAALVEYLESIAAPAYSQISAADYAKAGGLFDAQSIIPGGWLDTEHADSPPQDMYSLLRSLPAERICTRVSDLSVADVLAPSLREIIKIHATIVTWIESHISEPHIGLERRVQRLATLMDAVAIVRQRMRGIPSPTCADLLTPGPPGFVETAIMAALTGHTSQTYNAAWDALACRRKADSFVELLLPYDYSDSEPDLSPLTPDIGWILRMFAIVAAQKTRNDENLIVCVIRLRYGAFIADALAAGVKSKVPLATSRARLRWIRETNMSNSDKAVELEDAALEGAQNSRYAPNLFSEINDARASYIAQSIGLLDEYNKVMEAAVDSVPLKIVAEEMDGGSSSAVMREVAPVGLLNQDQLVITPDIEHRDALLAAVPTRRASFTFSCVGALVSVWPYQRHPFVFQLTLPSGSKCALKVPNYHEFCAWLAHLQSLPSVRMESSFDAGAYAARVEEYVDKGHSGPVFGMSLNDLQRRDGLSVPLAIERLLAEVERRGLNEQGIYRLSGSRHSVEILRATLDTTAPEMLLLNRVDIHVITSAVKLWLRELPEPVVPFIHYRELLETEKISDADERVAAIRKLVMQFPRNHFRVLRRLVAHLSLVTMCRKKNLMAPHNIGLVFSSTLLNPAPGSSSIAEGLTNLGRAAHVVKIMVVMHRQIFFEQGEEGSLDTL